jgi:hypothetical protein
MKPWLDCRESTRLVLEGEDRRLAWHERLAVRVHLAICAACPRFVAQVRFMRRSLGRWKAYAEEERDAR